MYVACLGLSRRHAIKLTPTILDSGAGSKALVMVDLDCLVLAPRWEGHRTGEGSNADVRSFALALRSFRSKFYRNQRTSK